MTMDLNAYLKDKQRIIEAALSESMEDGAIPKTLKDAMIYSLTAGGKRIRPVLVMAGAEAAGGDPVSVLPAAVAIEMIHAFSLIHDDLPAMDDDELRRGMPTNHKVFGEANAILAGDGLLAEAFYVLARARGKFDDRVLIDVMGDIAEATGARGMTGGQVMDMEATGKLIDEPSLTKLHLYKTGALLRVSVESGAKLCGAAERELKALDSYGSDIGLAFQIADDVLDVEGDENILGKDVGSDEENVKSTYPAVIGLHESKMRAAMLVDRAISALAIFGEKAEPLRLIARYIIERNR